MKDSDAGSTGWICLICSGVSILKSAKSRVIVYGNSENLIIWYPIALLLTVLSDGVIKIVSWFSNCCDGVTIPVALGPSGEAFCLLWRVFRLVVGCR